MEKFNLSEFCINKQVLKRKFKNDKYVDEHIENLLNQRTNNYTIDELKLLFGVFYTEQDKKRRNSKKSLTSYYAEQNRKKYENLLELIELKEKKDINILIEKDINKLVNINIDSVISEKILFSKFSKLSKKYNININEIERLYFEEEGKRIEVFDTNY